MAAGGKQSDKKASKEPAIGASVAAMVLENNDIAPDGNGSLSPLGVWKNPSQPKSRAESDSLSSLQQLNQNTQNLSKNSILEDEKADVPEKDIDISLLPPEIDLEPVHKFAAKFIASQMEAMASTHEDTMKILEKSHDILRELKTNQRMRSLELLGRALTVDEIDLLDYSIWQSKVRDAETLCHMVDGLVMEKDDLIFLPYTIPEVIEKRAEMKNLRGLNKKNSGMSHGGCFNSSDFDERDAANWSTIRSRMWKWISASNTDYFVCLDLWKKYGMQKKNDDKLREERFKMNLEVFLAGRKEGDSYRRFSRDLYRRSVSDVRRGHSEHSQNAINDSEYFVDKCMEALGEEITRVLTETLQLSDPVTQEKPEFWISLDGLTSKKRTGDAVVLTTFVGAERYKSICNT